MSAVLCLLLLGACPAEVIVPKDSVSTDVVPDTDIATDGADVIDDSDVDPQRDVDADDTAELPLDTADTLDADSVETSETVVGDTHDAGDTTSELGDIDVPDIDVPDIDVPDIDSGLDGVADGDDGDVDLGDSLDGMDTDIDTGPIVGPFDDLDGLSGAELRAALLNRIDDHTALGYSGEGTAREYMYAVLDVKNGRVECVYTGRTIAAENADAPPLGIDDTDGPIDTTPEKDCRYPDESPVPGGCFFNTEHCWPQSQGADLEPARSDIHHLFPTYEFANGTRSNYPLGDTTCSDSGCSWDENGSELGYAEAGYQAFEVRPDLRGNLARAQFYFAVRYAKELSATVEADLRAWHAADPPDEAEIARNEGIFAVQGNRNPFVSRPDFVALIDDF